jgi:hypothetical protein
MVEREINMSSIPGPVKLTVECGQWQAPVNGRGFVVTWSDVDGNVIADRTVVRNPEIP